MLEPIPGYPDLVRDLPYYCLAADPTQRVHFDQVCNAFLKFGWPRTFFATAHFLLTK